MHRDLVGRLKEEYSVQIGKPFSIQSSIKSSISFDNMISCYSFESISKKKNTSFGSFFFFAFLSVQISFCSYVYTNAYVAVRLLPNFRFFLLYIS